jgi:hypothetical protein
VLHSYAVLLIEKKDQEGQSQVLSAALEVRFNDNAPNLQMFNLHSFLI